MGRLGVTYADVAQSAGKLIHGGHNPTVDAVRAELGTGSKSTIAPFLKRWKLEQQGIIASATHKAMPESLSTLVNDLYGRLQQEARLELEEATTRYDQEICTAKESLEHVSKRSDEMEKLYLDAQENQNKLKNQLDESKSQQSLALEEIRLLQTKLGSTENWLQQRHEELKEQRAIVQRVQENFTHYQTKVQEQREQERLSFDSEISRLRISMHESQSELQQVQNENQALSDQTERLTQDIEVLRDQQNGKDVEIRQYVETIAELNSQVSKMEGQISILKQQIEACETQINDERTQVTILNRKLAISDHQSSTYRTENTGLREKIESLETELSKLLVHTTDLEISLRNEQT